jgi:multidrug efflux pump subunit AcrB
VHEVRWPRLSRFYVKIVIRLLRWRWATIAVTVAALAGLGWVFAAKVPRSSFAGWWNQRTTLSARVDFPSGSDPASVDQSVHELERIVVGRAGVENVQAQGDADGGYVVVTFDDAAAFTAIPLQMQEEVTQRAVLIGGASVGVSGRGPGFFNGGGSGSLASFRVKILGYSFAGVEQLAVDLKARLERIPRVKSVDINAAGFWFGRERASDVTLVPDRSALAGYGLNASQFAEAVTREVGGAAGRQRFALGPNPGAVARGPGAQRTRHPGAGRGPGPGGGARSAGPDQPRGSAVRPGAELRVPRAAEAGQPHPRSVHEVDLGATGLHRERRIFWLAG